MEQDFSRLLRTGKLDKPSLLPPGHAPPRGSNLRLPYRECGQDRLDKKKLQEQLSYSSSSPAPLLPARLALLLAALLEHL